MKIEWAAQASFIGLVSHKKSGRRLALIVGPDAQHGQVQILAIETSTNAENTEQVLEDHAHQVIDRHPDFPSAFRGAERYAKEWLKAKKAAGKPLENCTCGDIK